MKDLPQGWREVALNHVVSVSKETGIPSEKPEYPFVGMEHVASQTGEIVEYGNSADYKSGAVIADDALVLYGRLRPYLNKVFIPKSKCFASGEFIPLRVGPDLDKRYLLHLLRSANFVTFAVSLNAGDRPRVKWEQMGNFPLALPPLAEQERIVEILEEQFSRLDSALASVKAVREKTKAFRRSLLHSAFSGELTGGTEGWQTVNIDSLLGNLPNGKKVGQGWSPQCESVPASEGEWGVLKTTAIQAGRFEPEHNKRLPATLEPREAIEIQVGDLLMTCAGPRVRCGVPCLVRKTPQKLMMSGKMYRFRPDTKQVVPEYLEAYLLAPTTQSAINLLKTGISESGLNLTHARFFTLEVPKPPLATQERIVSLLEEQFSRLDKALEVANQLEARIASERRSLLHSAFTGALTATWRQNND